MIQRRLLSEQTSGLTVNQNQSINGCEQKNLLNIRICLASIQDFVAAQHRDSPTLRNPTHLSLNHHRLCSQDFVRCGYALRVSRHLCEAKKNTYAHTAAFSFFFCHFYSLSQSNH